MRCWQPQCSKKKKSKFNFLTSRFVFIYFGTITRGDNVYLSLIFSYFTANDLFSEKNFLKSVPLRVFYFPTATNFQRFPFLPIFPTQWLLGPHFIFEWNVSKSNASLTCDDYPWKNTSSTPPFDWKFSPHFLSSNVPPLTHILKRKNNSILFSRIYISNRILYIKKN